MNWPVSRYVKTLTFRASTVCQKRIRQSVCTQARSLPEYSNYKSVSHMIDSLIIRTIEDLSII